MWLLHARSFSLKHTTDSFAHAYAILSHTWEDDECTFQDLCAGSGKGKRGWLKVRNACAQALKDGLEYIWIDTVCINKESSAELSEAINSMWQWYCDAQVCYAYLSDVDKGCPELTDLALRDVCPTTAVSDLSLSADPIEDPDAFKPPDAFQPSDAFQPPPESTQHWLHAFARGRWFTRGWTLQELIAPEHVVFFDCGWSRIARKSSIPQALWKITRIDPLALENRASLPSLIIARKMSWARGRRTTRVEDRSYSLLGLMGVNMPLLYGEGERAFARLQEEIIKTSSDHSVFAWDEFPVRKYMTGEARDILFASSPDQFTYGAKMVRWVGDVVDLPFRVTNKGVSFDGLLITGKEPEYFAALNCRYEDDLRGTLALRLRQKDDIIGFDRSREFVSRDDFWVAEDRRLAIYTGFADASSTQSVRQLSILRYHPTWQMIPNAYRLPKSWLKFESSDADNFEIVRAWPQELWNRRTGIMVPQAKKSMFGPYLAQARKSTSSLHRIEGSVEISRKNSTSSSTVSIAFESPTHLHSASRTFKLAISPRSQQHARELLKDQDPSMKAHIETRAAQDFSNLSVKASELTEILGDLVCVLTVSKFDPYA